MHGITKAFSENYVATIPAKEYADIYSKLKISKRYLAYLATFV